MNTAATLKLESAKYQHHTFNIVVAQKLVVAFCLARNWSVHAKVPGGLESLVVSHWSFKNVTHIVCFFILHMFWSFPCCEVHVRDEGRAENISHDDKHIVLVHSSPPLLTAMTAIECRTQLV